MRTCSSCGAPAKPGEKFCGQCGLRLEPELLGEAAGQPVPAIPETGPKKKILITGVVLFIIVLALATGFMFMKGAGNTPPATTNQTRAGSSHVVVETEVPVTTSPATTLPVTTTPLPTEIPTTIKTPKYGICPTDRKLCNNNCTDILTDNKNCGSCGIICPAGQSCTNGHCLLSCSAGKTACPEGCFNLNTDGDHCGICGNNCPAGLICLNGQCALPPKTTVTAI